MESQGRRRLLPSICLVLTRPVCGEELPKSRGQVSAQPHAGVPTLLTRFGEIWFVSSALGDLVCSFSAGNLSLQRESSVGNPHRVPHSTLHPGLVRRWGLDLTVPFNSEARMRGGKLPTPGLLCTRHCVCISEKIGSRSPSRMGRVRRITFEP